MGTYAILHTKAPYGPYFGAQGISIIDRVARGLNCSFLKSCFSVSFLSPLKGSKKLKNWLNQFFAKFEKLTKF